MPKRESGPDPAGVDRATSSASKEFSIAVPLRGFHLRLLTVLPPGRTNWGRRCPLPLKLIWGMTYYAHPAQSTGGKSAVASATAKAPAVYRRPGPPPAPRGRDITAQGNALGPPCEEKCEP